MGVGPLHIIDEVAEGNEAMEKRERQEGITTGQAKGRTQRWQPLQPNLARVNEAARRSGQTRFTALLHHGWESDRSIVSMKSPKETR